ncbi:MAG: phosphoglycerate kinase, partial [Bacteroidales bacterium]|nr:phosphoglycerate kinase [Bacteroidales bacterium]
MTIDTCDFKGKKVIVRVDFNVPLDENGKITDDTRIRGALPTLKKVLADGGALIIMSHMGKPKGKVNAKFSLSQIVDAVSEKLGVKVQFAPDCAKAADTAAALKSGDVLLLENLRFYPEEEGKPVGIDKADPAYDEAKKAMKESQKKFAATLASYADIYINDAFGTAHRKHASTAVIADSFDADHKMLGYLMEKEVQAVDNVLSNIKRPFTAIMGGSKVSTKIGIIENLMDKVDNLILCGGMTYTFSKAMGGKIGTSICEDDKLDLALDIMAKAKAKGVNLVLGTDCVAGDAFSNDANQQIVPANNILVRDIGKLRISIGIFRRIRAAGIAGITVAVGSRGPIGEHSICGVESSLHRLGKGAHILFQRPGVCQHFLICSHGLLILLHQLVILGLIDISLSSQLRKCVDCTDYHVVGFLYAGLNLSGSLGLVLSGLDSSFCITQCLLQNSHREDIMLTDSLLGISHSLLGISQSI